MVSISDKISRTTHKSIAEAAGIDVSYVSMILSGKRTPSLGVSMRISNFLGITVDELAHYLNISLAGRSRTAA